jgi:hypothetical protein
MTDGRTITKTIETINNENLLIKKYNVTFKDRDGNILKEEIVKEGESATAPTAPTIEGFTFKGWDNKFDEVTGDLVITALYEEIKVEDPVDNEKLGCKKDLAYLATSVIALTTLGFLVFRKKEN